jgi:hypothetical protein
MHGLASSGVGCNGATALSTLGRSVTLPQAPRLAYVRRLDLDASVNISSHATFRVRFAGIVVDEENVSFARRQESDWVERQVDLGSFAGQTGELVFEVEAYSSVCIEVRAEAWIDDLRLGNPTAPLDTAAPVIAFVAPLSGAELALPATIELSASDDVGVTLVELTVDDAPLAALTHAPWTFDWTLAAAGAHLLGARAVDAAGNAAAVSAAVTVTAAPGDDGAPADGEGICAPDTDEPQGCGCRTGGAPEVLWGVAVLLLVRRRRLSARH